MLDFDKQTHRRYNPLARDWVLVSPNRTGRPWQGQIEENAAECLPDHDPDCYLCPGNIRAGGARNPQYESTYVFDNDFASMRPDTARCEFVKGGLLVAKGEPGVCRVVCFSPRHSLTISEMDSEEIRRVVDVWVEQYAELGALPFINAVQIFENRGKMMGASNPHPHCQIWANATVPNEMAKEIESFRGYSSEHTSCLLCDYLALEIAEKERVVCENSDFMAVVPFWAVWPYEILLIGKRHVTGIDKLVEEERDNLADVLRSVTIIYEKLFNTPFPYTMGFHQRPTDGSEHADFHMHAHFYPPLLRSASVRKFMVGYEMLASPQRDITPEEAAGRLRVAASAGIREGDRSAE